MLKRIALMLEIRPEPDRLAAELRVSNTETDRALTMPHGCSLLLTLEREQGASYVRGHVKLLGEGIQYPFQSNAALFEALSEYVAQAAQER